MFLHRKVLEIGFAFCSLNIRGVWYDDCIRVRNKEHMTLKKKERVSCETCTFYVYDDEYGAYLCDMNMDEDDYVRIMSDRYYQCPYYRNGDEYAVVRKQM